MTQLFTAMSTLQLFRALVPAGGEEFSTFIISRGQLRALYIQDGHLAVASLSDHLSAGGAVATVTGESTWVGASGEAGLTAALFTLFTLFPGPGFLPFGVKGHSMALPAAAMVSAGQSSSTNTTARERPTCMTRYWTHLMLPETDHGYGHLAGRAG